MGLTADQLAEGFDAIAQDDPEMRIDLSRCGTDVTATLAAGAAHPESTRRFRALVTAAVALFDPDGAAAPSSHSAPGPGTWKKLTTDSV